MKHPLPNLESLKAFESAARHLSFSHAARELCITKSAVSYQIKKLENELGVPLFKRNIRQVLLTDQGQKMQQVTSRVFSEMAAALARLESDSSRPVVIAATTYVAARWLSPQVTEFCENFPEVSLRFQHTVNSSSFDLNEVDIAIRWGRCNGRRDDTRLLEIPMAMFPVCSPLLLERAGIAGEPGIFNDTMLLCEDREQDLWLEWAAENHDLVANPRRVIADANVRVQAAIDGQGLVLADAMMMPEINSGVLERVNGLELRGYGYVVMSSRSAQRKPEVRALLEVITGNPKR